MAITSEPHVWGWSTFWTCCFCTKSTKGRRWRVPVRRHAHLQQTFSKIQFVEHEELDAKELANKINQELILSFPQIPEEACSFQLPGSKNEHKEPKERKINILIPLSDGLTCLWDLWGTLRRHASFRIRTSSSLFCFSILTPTLTRPSKLNSWETTALALKADMQILPCLENFQELWP